MEPPGMSALEAGLGGAPLVLSDCDWSREYFGDQATLVDPASADSIRHGVETGLGKDRTGTALADRIRGQYRAPDALAPLAALMNEVSGKLARREG